jgi:hypothetical protein
VIDPESVPGEVLDHRPPDGEWVAQQARNLLMNLVDHADGLKFLVAIAIVTSRVARIKVVVVLPAP